MSASGSDTGKGSDMDDLESYMSKLDSPDS